MNAIHELTQEEIDAGLEREIETARLAAMSATDSEIARAGFQAMAELVAMRSPARVEQMEAQIDGLKEIRSRSR